jgi:hypothetical protein
MGTGGCQYVDTLMASSTDTHVTIDVPESTFVAVILPIQALSTFTPSAQTSRTRPKLEKGALTLLESTAPIVLTLETQAGLVIPASTLELPAATFK